MKKVNLTFLGAVLIICTVIISQFTPGLGSISSALAKSDSKVASTIIRTRAVLASAGKEYFVSPDGSSSGTCLVETPCTYTRAEQLANAGDTITFLQGTYGAVIVGKDGLTLQGKNAVIDTTAQNGIRVARNNVTVRDFIVQRTWSHAVLVTGKNVTVENVTVRESIRENANITNDLISSCKSTGWGSGIKAQLGAENVVFRGNTVHNNCGEGIAVTRGIGALVENNVVYDNFSVNIYVDNSNGVVVRNNVTSCYDPHFYRNNKPAQGVLLGIENYSGWGNQMHDILIANNYVEACGGIRLYAENGYTLGENVVIHDNVFWNVPTPFVYVPGATVYNNVSDVPTLTPTATSVPPTATSVPSTATTNLTFTTVADTYVVQDQPDTNFGTNPSLRVDNTPLMRSYLRFTVSGLNGATIQSAKLRLYANSASDVGYSVYAVSDNNWDEHTMTFNNSNQVTFNNSPASGIHITNSQPFPSDVWTEVDISGYVKAEGTYTLLLTTSSDTTTRLASRDSGNNAPQLVVSTISQVSPSVAPTATSIAPTATSIALTATSVTPTVTSIAPTATSIAPTATSVAPTATSVAPTATSIAPTATSVAPTATKIPPTATPANTPISGTVWYVNNTATGNNTGTSWNNAWKSFADVNFSTIGSEATLYISGGTTSKTYAGTLNVPPGTTSATITKGVDAGHNVDRGACQQRHHNWLR